MQSSPPLPATSLNGHGTEAGQRLIALAASLVLGSSWMMLPALSEDHNPAAASKQNASSHQQNTAASPDKPGPAKLPVIPALPVPDKADGGKPGPGQKSAPASEPALDPKTDPKGVIDQALKAYKTGHYGQAAAILANDLQVNPDDGTVHYYMGMALKRQGMDMKALNELEKAARLCPPEMIKKFADEQIGNLDEPEPLGGAAKAAPAPAPPGDWLSGLGNGINQMFGGKPAAPTVAGASTTDATKSSGTPAFPPLSFFPAMPDVMGQIKDAVKQGKKMLRGNAGPDKGPAKNHVDFSRRQAGEAEIMHMDEMQALVQKSHAMNMPDWASSSDGLTAFDQAPEGTPEWDYWIGRFKRSFQHVLLRRLNKEATDQVHGAAACIFSVDRAGNLRGQVYATTADPALNKCLVEAIRDLNHSRVLAFPSTTRISGWNFQMSWNFGVYLAIVDAYREQQKREATVEALLKMVKEDTTIKAILAKDKEKIARAKRLAAEKVLKAKLVKPVPDAKAEVSGRVVSRGAERELQAVAIEMKDLTPVSPGAAQPNEDPFANINDRTINSWPDLNR